MGFLGEALWSSRGVCVSKEEVSQQQSSWSDLRSVRSCGNSEDHRSTSSFLCFSALFIALTRGQMVIWCWLEFQTRPRPFHTISPPLQISHKGKQRPDPCSSCRASLSRHLLGLAHSLKQHHISQLLPFFKPQLSGWGCVHILFTTPFGLIATKLL